MNIMRLINLARAASGGGVGYSVSVDYGCTGELGDTNIDVKVFRWDSINKEGISYCDHEFEMMRQTEMTAIYRPLEEGIMKMREDAHLTSYRAGDVEVRMNARGAATRQRIIKYVRTYIEENGVSPTRMEIIQGASVAGGSSLDYLLRTMREVGLITYDSRIKRSIKVNEEAVDRWLKGAETA